VSVVIPTINEARNLAHVLPRLPEGIDQVILVDGGSTDGTVEVARQIRPEMAVIQQTRRGKGNALACGFAAATGDIIVMMDADGSTDPAEISRFVDALVNSDADFAKGSRFIGDGGSQDITWLRRMGNKGLNLFVNTLCRTRYTDLCYGYNAFWRHCLPAFDLDAGGNDLSNTSETDEKAPMLWGDGFEIETLLNIRVAGESLRVVEVPSFERNRLHGRSNLNAFSDGFRVLRTILVEWRRQHAMKAKQAAGMGAIVELRPPRLDDEALELAASQVNYCGLADGNL
jgi:glycosyltransferase involved in cell wall biosynthesis